MKKYFYNVMNKITWKFIKFGFVGGTSALINVIIFNIFFWFGISFVLCVILGIFLSIPYNFLMNRSLTFKANHTSIQKQWWKHVLVYFISQGTYFGVSFFMVSILGEGTVQANISVIIGIAISIPLSFFGSFLWTFRKPYIVTLKVGI